MISRKCEKKIRFICEYRAKAEYPPTGRLIMQCVIANMLIMLRMCDGLEVSHAKNM